MTVEVSIFLFGKPAWEIDGLEGGDLDDALIEQIRAKGKELNESLDHAADLLTKLRRKGWEGSGTLYDVSLFKDVSLGVARKELSELGLDPALAFEFEEEEETNSSGIEK
jgi:hypothetical protein